MKDVDYTQLLFAAEVHKLATARYTAASNRAAARVGESRSDMYAWEKANPFSDFEKGALQSILHTAGNIAELIEAGEKALGRAPRA